MAAVLIVSSGCNFVYAADASAGSLAGLDEYIATDLVGSKTSGAGSGGTSNDADAQDAIDNKDGGDETLYDAVSGVAASDAGQARLMPKASRYTYAEALAEEYRPDDGFFALSGNSRFYIAGEESPDPEIIETVKRMVSEFAAYEIPSSEPLPVVYGEPELARSGDIVISLVSEEDFLPGIQTADINQTYRIDVYDKVYVEACHLDGLWYGLTELLEMARENQMQAARTKSADVQETDNDIDDVSQTAETDQNIAQSGDAGAGILLERFHIKDGPDIKERAIMLDCGRKYYSKEWIENFIKRASLQRYNALVLHFAEAEGIRLDSEVFPWLTENIESLSAEEMKEIVYTAQQYHMDVIPSFDTPGHNTFMIDRYAQYVKENPDFSFTLDGKTYDSSISGFRSIANHYSHAGETKSADYIGVDLTKEHAVAFTEALIDGYADFFRKLGCTRMDIGSDEMLGWYSFELGGKKFSYDNRWSALEHWKTYARDTLGIRKGSASDVFITYINELAARLEGKGYTCRVFNDEIDINANQHVELSPSIEITYWFDADNTAGHFADKGHVMHNFMESWCFYVLRRDKGKDIMDGKYKTVNARNIFENWDPENFARKASGDMRVPDDKMGGAYFAIWCDHPDYKSAETVWAETEMKTWANASKMWNIEISSDKSGIGSTISYKQMKGFVADMAGFPGYSGDPEERSSLPDTREVTEGTTGWERTIADIRRMLSSR